MPYVKHLKDIIMKKIGFYKIILKSTTVAIVPLTFTFSQGIASKKIEIHENSLTNKENISSLHSSKKTTNEAKLGKIYNALRNAAEFSVYKGGRPTQVSSRQEGWELMERHCKSMVDFHKDMAEQYEERISRYLSEEMLARPGVGRGNLQLFLKVVLGYDLPKETDPALYLKELQQIHQGYQQIWQNKLSGFTGKTCSGYPARRYDPTLENYQRLKQMFIQNFNDYYEQVSHAFEMEPAKILKNKILTMAIDELWALRYGIAVLEPLARQDYDEERALKQAKNRKKRARKRARQTALKNKILALSAAHKEEIQEKAEELLSAHSDTILTPRMSDIAEKEIEEETQQLVDLIEPFDLNDFVKEEQKKTMLKKEELRIAQKRRDEKKEYEIEEVGVTKVHMMNIEHYNVFMDLFENQNVKFNDFIKAFEKGLKGKVYKNKGGSVRTFSHERYSFNLHKPHGGQKGSSVFYDELRRIALRRLSDMGVTKDTVKLVGSF